MNGIRIGAVCLTLGAIGGAADLAASGWDGREDCRFEEDRAADLAVRAGESFYVDVGSGTLRIEGRRDAQAIRVTGRACASEEESLDELRIALDRRGDRAVLTAYYPDRDGWDGFRDYTARIDLVVEVPAGMEVEIDDSSGEIEVSGTGALRIDDGSGEILAIGIDGPVWIDDSSGDIDLRDIAGDVEVEDGSGGIDVRDVGGSVRIRDGSGSIVVGEADGDVIVERDGSGSIDVHDVAGDFTVLRDGSGGIRYDRVEGRVDVPRDKRRRGRK